MTSRDFCYWLQGLFELGAPTQLDAKQTDLVKRHLAMVFKHEIDPSMGAQKHQQELNQIHEGTPPQSQGLGRVHTAGCQMDTDHPGKCETRRQQIGGAGPDGIVYRC